MRIVVLHSGGLDSTVLLAHLVAGNHECYSFSIDYGQRHRKELEAATDLAWYYHARRRQVSLPPGLFAASSQTSDDVPVPHGHFEDESMKKTVVPNRNMVLLSLATAYALRVDAEVVAYAAHAGDHAIYPDCRPEFIAAMRAALSLCDWKPVSLRTPFADLHKADIVRLGHELGVPFEKTWTCYEGGMEACGRCGACVERLDAFRRVGIPDPLPYAAD